MQMSRPLVCCRCSWCHLPIVTVVTGTRAHISVVHRSVAAMKLFFQPRPPSPKDAILKIREIMQTLEKREAHLQAKIAAELKIARSNATTNKRGKKVACTRPHPPSHPVFFLCEPLNFPALLQWLVSLGPT